ncbi:MAG: parallel beta-helix domain-containing protein, partial [Myxococcota bacterium]
EAYNAADAGLYVGQSINVIVRRNIARQNVAGLEIENTQFAVVYENVVEDNSTGLVVFDLPGNPVIGRDVKVHDNIIRDNNRDNFALAGTTVATVPAGTGTFVLASRRVEFANNTYARNKTTDIAILSGLVIEANPASWAIPLSEVVGSTVGIELTVQGDNLLNFSTGEIWIHDNTHEGSGTAPDASDMDARPLGALLGVVYFGAGAVDTLLYDGVGEDVDPSTPANNTNRNRICAENEGDATWATLGILDLLETIGGGGFPTVEDIYRVSSPYAPFNCTGFTNGPIADVSL